MDKKERMRRIRALLDESQKTVVHRPTVAANDDHCSGRLPPGNPVDWAYSFLENRIGRAGALVAVALVAVTANAAVFLSDGPMPQLHSNNLAEHIEALDTAPPTRYQPVTHDLPPIVVAYSDS